MTDATPYHVPKEPGRWRALTLAAAVHAALLTFLWIGVRWQNATPVSVEAEVWSPQVREAAPRPQPEPEPVARPEPKPEVKAPPKPETTAPPVVKPDIALAQEKKRKEREQKAREEEERIKQQRVEEEREKKLRAEKMKTEEAATRKREEELRKKEAEAKKRKQELTEQAAREKSRADDLKRMLAQAGSGGSGDAPKTQGTRGDAGYAGKVGAKIKSNTIFNVPENLPRNAAVEYAVELLPDGSIRHPVRKIKSSGVPGFDEAVLNAIEKSQPYPPDKSGKVPSGFNVVHQPKDQ